MLDQVLWACRTSLKEAINTTPFRQTYGNDVVLPIKIYLQLIRIERQNDIPSENYWDMALDELVDVDKERLSALERLIRKSRICWCRHINRRLSFVGNWCSFA